MAQRLDYAGHKPHQGTSGAAGLDLYATEDSGIADGTIELVGTGTRLAIPNGFFGLLAIRSSLGSRGISLANGIGVIDSDYRGEIKVPIIPLDGCHNLIQAGQKIAQLIIMPIALPTVEVVAELPESVRGLGGFGSTDA